MKKNHYVDGDEIKCPNCDEEKMNYHKKTNRFECENPLCMYGYEA
jgi:ribosomal protein S27E